MINTAKGSHLSLFPMHTIARIMDTNGYDFPDARRWVLNQTCEETGLSINMSPKFHESFNYIVDVLEGRFIPCDSTSLAISKLISYYELNTTEPELTRKMFTYLEPSQLATLKPICDLAFSESSHNGVCTIVSLKQILPNMFAETFGLTYLSARWVYSDLMQIALLLSLKDVLAHWSNR